MRLLCLKISYKLIKKNKNDVFSLILTTNIIFFHTQYDQYYDKVKVNLFQNFLTPPTILKWLIYGGRYQIRTWYKGIGLKSTALALCTSVHIT